MGNVNQFLAVLRKRLKDQYIQDWSNALENSTRVRFYRNISGFYFQPHLEFITINKFRIAMTKLRVSSNQIEVEMDQANIYPI